MTRDEEQRQHLFQVVKEIGKRQADPLDTPNPNASRASKKVFKKKELYIGLFSLPSCVMSENNDMS